MVLPVEKVSLYRRHLRRRLSQSLTATELSELKSARAEAEQVAWQLVREHGAKRVLLFGSIARGWPLRPESDIDLAVEGMPADRFFKIGRGSRPAAVSFPAH